MAELLLECGRLALNRRTEQGWTLKEDGSLVTEIDRQIEALLGDTLPATGEYFIGEETIAQRGMDYMQAALRAPCWVVDPIDGTSSFAHGFPLWGISIGYMLAGKLCEGAVVVPECGDLLVSDGDAVRHYRLATATAPLAAATRRDLSAASGDWQAGGLLMLGQRFCRQGRLHLPNPLLASGSAVEALTALLLGQAQAYIGHMKLWDIAGILPMLEHLGYSGRLADGARISCDLKDGAFDLDPDSADCWALRDNCLICADAWHSKLDGAIQWSDEK
jgi:myo-inositol-1(or 4)-monophosphatase